MSLPTDPAAHKATPIFTGFLDYFPDAVAEVARLSAVANEQHSPGEPVHWARGKSTDHADSLCRHLMSDDTWDNDGQRHTAKVAWRAMALLQTELEDYEDAKAHQHPTVAPVTWPYAKASSHNYLTTTNWYEDPDNMGERV